MDKYFVLLCIILLFSCKNKGKEHIVEEKQMTGITNKLETLLRLSPDTVLPFYDLSDDFLMTFPDLSAYTIKSLNLSHNYLDTLILAFLPKGLEFLDLSYNELRYIPDLRYVPDLKYIHDWEHISKTNTFVKELNLSYNHIESFFSDYFIDRLDLSHNNLHYINFNWSYMYYYGYWGRLPKNMNYLNISNNPKLNNKVMFVPSMIDTIIHNNIANDKKLEMIDWLRQAV